MANRKISELPEISYTLVDDVDLLTLVHIFEVDPTLRNKRLTFSGLKGYLDQRYAPVVGVPASATASGVSGEVALDADYFYVCVSGNTWKRAALTTW